MLGGSFYGQLRLIPRIKITSTDGELPFIISRRQFPIRLYFTITVNKLQGQSFNFIRVNLYIPVFTHRQLYIILLRVTDIGRLSLLLRQGGDATTTNIIYPEVLLPVTG
jgi:ATP-dependent DNA helicase PIF1